ncbi:GEVED domain-containing protein [Rubrivirga sp. IMCC43871]|uniref:GEVED domain-containing protein n=1 Tax=Rubrivirga sp. IMCC43871 TaxID=3391575 RepID=UPI0039903A18
MPAALLLAVLLAAAPALDAVAAPAPLGPTHATVGPTVGSGLAVEITGVRFDTHRSDTEVNLFTPALFLAVASLATIEGELRNESRAGGGPTAIQALGLQIFTDIIENNDFFFQIKGARIIRRKDGSFIVESDVVSCEASGGGEVCHLELEAGPMEPNEVFDFEVEVAGVRPGEQPFEITMTQNEFDPDPTNNTASGTVTVTPPEIVYGQKWYDPDGDGARDDGEGPVDGWPVDLLASDGSVAASTVTGPFDLDFDGAIDPLAERGVYAFPLPAPGAYTVAEALPSGWTAVPAGGVHEIQVADQPVGALDFFNRPDVAPDTDWGDAPDTYLTTAAVGGPAHFLMGFFPPILGVQVDPNDDGVPTIDASGDDLFIPPDQVDDEDGLVGITFGAGNAGELTVEAPFGGTLDAWLDHDDDGTFNQPDNQIVAAGALGFGQTTFTFTIPTGATRGGMLRLRVHDVPGGVGPAGLVADGEVEDHLTLGLDLGDANQDPLEIIPGMPFGYPVRISADGARHLTNDLVRIGERVDAETDLNAALGAEVGLASNTATGDDNDPDDNQNDGPRDDEDGIAFGDGFVPFTIQLPVGTAEPSAPNPLTRYGLVAGTTGTLTIFPNVDGGLDGWFDWNRDGDWDDPGEHVFANERIGPSTPPPTLDVTAPATAPPGFYHARFRFSRNGALRPVGVAPDGEVEDYLMATFAPMDWGDAPAPYPSAAADGGPRHAVGAVRLGTAASDEPDALAADDDDGVALPAVLGRGGDATVSVVVSGDAPGALYGFVDFNADGDFDDAGEQVLDGTALAAGTHDVTVAVPLGATPGPTWARFRVSRVPFPFTAGGPVDATAVPFVTEGEVEDYAVEISANPVADEPAPDETALEGVGPNPARSAVTVRLALAAPCDVDVAVHDALGRRVLHVPAGAQPAGRHTLRLGLDRLPAGVYVIVVGAGEARFTRSVVVVR